MRMLHWKKQGFCINTIFFTRRHIGTSSMRHTILNCGPLRLQCSIAEGASSIIRADASLLLPSLICRSSYLPSRYCTLVRGSDVQHHAILTSNFHSERGRSVKTQQLNTGKFSLTLLLLPGQFLRQRLKPCRSIQQPNTLHRLMPPERYSEGEHIHDELREAAKILPELGAYVSSFILTLFRTNDTVMVLLGTIKSAGIGLDFSRATFVIHPSRCWNPATINQGSDHVIRSGQEDNVVLWHLYTNRSMDEKMWAFRQAKMARAHTLLDPKDIEHWSEEEYVK
jgi:hypothetical protein